MMLLDLGLVKSGKLLNSIKCISNGNGSFSIEAEDYYEVLDEKYNITSAIIDNQQVVDLIETILQTNIEKEI